MEPTWTLKDGTLVHLVRGADISNAIPRWYVSWDKDRPAPAVVLRDLPNKRTNLWVEDSDKTGYWCLVEVGQPSAQKPVLTTDKAERKATPITTGVIDYFPRALAEIARVSKAGNDQHNPGQPLHWDKNKSTDHADCISRHLIERGTIDDDGMRHSAKLAWRALALLETELEAAGQ